MATEGTKYQLNFKTHKDGTLINLYADSIKELETQITDIAMITALIKSTEAGLYTGPQFVAPAPTVASVAAAFNATPVAQNPGSAPSCRHGVMNYREGVGQRGPWKAYMCSSPQGTPKEDKCDAIFKN